MINTQTPDAEPGGMQSMLDEKKRLLEDYHSWRMDFMETSYSETAERTQWWESMISGIKNAANTQQLSSYKSLAQSMGGLLGGSIRDQAKVMVPFEIAESTKEFARFLGTRDPSALASSIKHALAAKQYAAAAKSGSGGASHGGGAVGGGAAPAGAGHQEEPSRQARVIVNVGRQVGVVDTYEFARTLIDAINENVKDDVILEVAT